MTLSIMKFLHQKAERKTDGELNPSERLYGLQAYPQMPKENQGLVN